ncbi:amidohydrolase family protein [Chitinophaga rhizophila]|uniref:Amidohydrolase family protein n=1 Tax=Chitinophaga rhizophila TaxID=2866212 RepID=A0ABS7GIL8_9BACT|nr:amidohydrolase family protein [Chitinophaga rhizophila]MBW8687166.1 amidohydrolase family protein [Chitinophaga rhizophila]
MRPTHITRKDFIRNSALAAFGAGLTPALMANAATEEAIADNAPAMAGNTMKLKNVRLETGFEYEGEEVIATTTDLFCIEINDGKFTAILPNDPKARAIDAKGLLLLPAFRDMHIHLDKTFYGGPWQAARKRQGGVKGMIALEQQILPQMLKTSTAHAERLIELLQSCGSDFARSHVNIEPTSKLDSLKHLQKALENKKDTFSAELVAFPQHGLYYTDAKPYMKEAAKMNIDFIGGVDPYSLDGEIAKPMDFIIQLALDNNKGVDIHLHEAGESGLKTVEYLIDRVNENPVLKGKTFLSHCFVLGKLPPSRQEEIADKLAQAQIGIMSTIPFGGLIMPIPTLYKYGVKVATGNDSIIDHWNTWGSGSVLQKANLMAQLYGYSTELLLSRSLRLATCDVLPLDDKGNRQWPAKGDVASAVLIDASCSAEAVSRVSPVKSLIHQGTLVF